jgi:hypothetical protein
VEKPNAISPNKGFHIRIWGLARTKKKHSLRVEID